MMMRAIGPTTVLLVVGGLASVAYAAPAASAQNATTAKAAQSAPAATDTNPSTIDIVAASQIIGRDLRDPSGANAGTIQSLVIDTRTGVVDFVVVGSSGNFNTNGSLVAVPWPALQPPAVGNGPITTKVSVQKMLDSPHISQTLVNNLNQPGYRSRIYGYYGYSYPGYYRNGHGYGPYGPFGYGIAPGRYGPYGPGSGPAAAAGPAPGNQANARAAQGVSNAAKGPANGTPGTNSQMANNANANAAVTSGQPATTEPGGQNASGLLVSRKGIISTLNQPRTTSANALQNATIYSLSGETIGNVNQVMIDSKRGEVAFVLLSRGGFVGLDQRWYALPIEALVPAPYQGGYRLTANEQTLLQEPGFTVDQNNLPTQVSATQLASLYQRFGMQPYWEQTRQQKIAEQKNNQQQNAQKRKSPNEAAGGTRNQPSAGQGSDQSASR